MILRALRLAGLAVLGMAGFLPVISPHMTPAQTPAPSLQPWAEVGLALIRQCFEQDRTAEALEAADKFAWENAGHPEALMQLAGLLAIHAQDERAAAVFGRVNDLRPHSPEVLYNLGVALYHCQKLDKAAAALAESADLDERPAETHYSLALIAAERGDHENSIIELRHATERAPRHANYYAVLGEEFSRSGTGREPRPRSAARRKLSPRTPRISCTWVMLLFTSKTWMRQSAYSSRRNAWILASPISTT